MAESAHLPAFQPDAFRKALGNFATGVTIVTSSDAEGEPVGVTASSFNSVSLDPPLVLWSLAKGAMSRPAFCDSGHFAIHILTDAQEELSNRFARTGIDKFSDLGWDEGQLGSPILREHAAVFECATRHQYDGGDHIIMVGEVVAFEARDKAPLLFHGGQYAERTLRQTARAGAAGSIAAQPRKAVASDLQTALDTGMITAGDLGDILDSAAFEQLAKLVQKRLS